MRTVIRMSAATVAAAILLGMFCHGMLNYCFATEPLATKPITPEELANYAADCARYSAQATTNPVIAP